MDNRELVSVYTCVYNGAATISKTFDSMLNQTHQNLEHIIVDDGSTDETKYLVNEYREKANYSVIYLYQRNSGKHVATNRAWEIASGTYITQLDADDELLPDAIAILLDGWSNIPLEKRNQYWNVVARCKTQKLENMIGEPFVDGINLLSENEAKKLSNIAGKKIGLMRTDIVKNCLFPEPRGVKFVTESIVWSPINQKFNSWYLNDIVRVYYVDENENSLSSRRKTSQGYSNWCHNYSFFLKRSFKLSAFELLKVAMQYTFSFHLSTLEFRINNTFYKNLKECSLLVRVFCLLLFIPTYIYAHIIKKIKLYVYKGGKCES